jgi:positive regulator of sigma E activity
MQPDNTAKLRILRPLSILSPLLTLVVAIVIFYFLAKLDVNLAVIISVVIAAMEWLFLTGIVRKLESDDKTIG